MCLYFFEFNFALLQIIALCHIIASVNVHFCVFVSAPYLCTFLTRFPPSISGTEASATAATTKAGAVSDTSSAGASMNANNNKNVRFRNKDDLLRDLTSSPGTSNSSSGAGFVSGHSSGGHSRGNISSTAGRPPAGKSVGSGVSGARTSRPLFEVR